MVKANHPKATDIMDPVIKILKMSWRTEANFVDCGVFAMRHMEVYKGNGTVGFDTGFLKEDSDQKKQLDGLRVKFLTKLLLSDLNMRKNEIMKESEEYEKLPGFEKAKLKADSLERIEARLIKMI